MKALLLALATSTALFLSPPAAGVASDPQVESFLRAFADALMARDGKPMLSRLSDKYAIAGLPDGIKATDVFEQAVERIQGPTEIVIQSVAGPPAQRIAKAEFRFTRGEPKVKTMRFDAQGKLVESDLFVMRVHGS